MIAMAKDNSNINYLLTLDNDDIDTNNDDFNNVIELMKKKATITVIRGNSSGKIHACNRDMSRVTYPWDIVILMSDDMVCQAVGWDEIIRKRMTDYFPDLDGVLWFNDGFVGERLNTLCILGRYYYNRFNYIYHPSYKSLWCDNEFMEVAESLEKQKYFEQVLFKHDHPANIGSVADELYKRNDKHYQSDGKNYKIRKAQNFGL